MRSAPIVHHPAYAAQLAPDHRFPMGKFAALAAHLESAGLVGPDGFHVPAPASFAHLCLAHDGDYVRAVLDQTLSPAQERRIGFPVNSSIAQRAMFATGGTLLTARLALIHGVACNTAGGSHHAARAGGAGFCVFNDVAVACLTLLAERAVERILIIDLDVHQGDGTADIVRDEPRVFCLSVHCEQNFPTRKVAGDLDVGLMKGAGDDEYLAALAPALDIAFARARPQLVFFNAGVDPHSDDELGLLALTDVGLLMREQMVFAAARAHGAALAGVIGGGYNRDVQKLARRHAILHCVAAEQGSAD
jgi:acetoin utilization deacetylase AcuC-like enzyme